VEKLDGAGRKPGVMIIEEPQDTYAALEQPADDGNPNYSPHMPRSRAPQVRQGPSSKAAAECEPLATANTEIILSTFGLSHFPQSTLADEEVMIFSNRAPQSRHLYSKIGIGFSLLQYNECQPTIQR
jgi:hypothetical protein